MSDLPYSTSSVMKPVRLPASATLTLPRWGLIVLCLLYILPGLLGRDPWKNIDAANFGVMWTMAQGTLQDWVLPNVSGAIMPRFGPLTFWIGAIFIKLFQGAIGAVLAARMATLFFFAIAAYSIWHTAFILGQHPEVQPMRLAFGGQPEPKDYGRVLADSTLLVYLGCFGLILFSHETSVNALYVALISLTLLMATKYVEKASIKHALFLGLSIGCLVLTCGLVIPITLYIAFFVASFFLKIPQKKALPHLVLAILCTVLLFLIWFLLDYFVKPYDHSAISLWFHWCFEQVDLPSIHSTSYFFKYALWGFWPAWPYALWAIYAWRRQFKEPHILLPLIFTIAFLILIILSFQKEETLMLAMFPPLAILAAFGLPTMKRSAINAIDWFSVMAFTIIATVIWVCWIAAQTGVPQKIAKNALKLAPGFVPEVNPFSLLVALLATIGWFILVYWRISRRPSVLWRAIVLSSGGVILCWLLLATLWLPWINYNKTYVPVAKELANHISDKHACVAPKDLSWAQRASFSFFANIRFEGLTYSGCEYLLIQDTAPKRNRPKAPKTYLGKTLVWEGHRPSDRTERFRLYQTPYKNR